MKNQVTSSQACSSTDTITGQVQEFDVDIVTSSGITILAHSSLLVSVSTVFQKILDHRSQHSSSTNTIPILGVPCDAVVAFVQILYSSRCTEEEMDRYGIHLLALSHVYSIHHLKTMCTKGLGERLMTDNLVDLLQLARLCDAPDLYLKCVKMLSNNLERVQMTEGWKFIQENDPWLELEILQLLDEIELMNKRRRKNKEEQCLYMQLSEAMECLHHICTDGCTSVGPYDAQPNQHKEPCAKFSTCHGLQLLIKHFALCTKRVKGGCCSCKRMWQLLRLHSTMCYETDQCKVPLCRQFKLRREVRRWKLLARKVTSAKAVASLSSSKRK